MSKKIEFVDYTGKWPNLCSGIFIVNIDGQETHFGSEYYEEKKNQQIKYYPCFWLSGGSTWFSGDYEEGHIETGPWYYDEELDNFPEFDKEDIKELMKVFNDNVLWGCCGGCL